MTNDELLREIGEGAVLDDSQFRAPRKKEKVATERNCPSSVS